MEERKSAANADEIAKYYDEYFKSVYRYVYREIPNVQVAEDIAQDTFLVALEKADDFLAHPKPELWLLRTARNKMKELYRRMKYWKFEPLEENEEPMREDPIFEYREVHLSALAILSEEEWDLFRRYYLCGESISELADSLGISEGNMRVRFTRMKKKLQDGMR